MIWTVAAKEMRRGIEWPGDHFPCVTFSWEPLLGPVPPPRCSGGCDCYWREDADRHDCGCDGGCCEETWDILPDGEPRPDITERYVEIWERIWLP